MKNQGTNTGSTISKNQKVWEAREEDPSNSICSTLSGFMDPDFTLISQPIGNLSGQIQGKGEPSKYGWVAQICAQGKPQR